MTTAAQLAAFESKRNAQLKGKLVKCGYCGYMPINYFDFVKHREAAHGIPRGEADVYPGPAKGQPGSVQ